MAMCFVEMSSIPTPSRQLNQCDMHDEAGMRMTEKAQPQRYIGQTEHRYRGRESIELCFPTLLQLIITRKLRIESLYWNATIDYDCTLYTIKPRGHCAGWEEYWATPSVCLLILAKGILLFKTATAHTNPLQMREWGVMGGCRGCWIDTGAVEIKLCRLFHLNGSFTTL